MLNILIYVQFGLLILITIVTDTDTLGLCYTITHTHYFLCFVILSLSFSLLQIDGLSLLVIFTFLSFFFSTPPPFSPLSSLHPPVPRVSPLFDGFVSHFPFFLMTP